jgi:hypothetical protein
VALSTGGSKDGFANWHSGNKGNQMSKSHTVRPYIDPTIVVALIGLLEVICSTK